MTENVLVTISGVHMMGGENEDVKLMIPGTCEEEDDCLSIEYEEPAEDEHGAIRNRIRIGKGCMFIEKKGMVNVTMSFLNRSERTVSCYSTPFGDFMIGITTRDIGIEKSSDLVTVRVNYSMDIGDQQMSECSMCVEIRARREED